MVLVRYRIHVDYAVLECKTSIFALQSHTTRLSSQHDQWSSNCGLLPPLVFLSRKFTCYCLKNDMPGITTSKEFEFDATSVHSQLLRRSLLVTITFP